MDTMTVLGAILDAGLEDVAAFAVFDPQAVQQMIAAGVGRRASRCSLGGKLDMPAIGLKGQPRTVSGRVKLICDGRYRNRGPDGARRAATTWGRRRCSTPGAVIGARNAMCCIASKPSRKPYSVSIFASSHRLIRCRASASTMPRKRIRARSLSSERPPMKPMLRCPSAAR